MTVPRTAEYLAINPRGLVPSIEYEGEIFTESAVVAWLLADANPGKLVKASSESGGPQARARVNFFVDAYFSKFQSEMMKLYTAKTEEDSDKVIDAAVKGLVKEVEPLLQDANPFFGGSSKITMAEVLTGSFILRLISFSKAGIFPAKTATAIAEQAPNFWKWAQATAAHPNVNAIYDEDKVIAATSARIAKMRAS